MRIRINSVSTLALVFAVPAYTQTLPSTPAPSDASAPQPAPAVQAPAASGGLQEIVVTAQKRSENLQTVPIAVTAASGAELTSRGITSSLQLNTVAPGLNIRTTAGSFQPSIRGVGTSSNVVENPVALYIDGVYLPQQREGLRQLEDIEQIAVLKGPQGTLFGRNATGGVIQITTLAPSHTAGGEVKAEVDEYATLRGSAYLTGGLTDTLAGSISASYAHQGNGWGKNLATGDDTFKLDHDFAARAKLLFEPTSATSITLIADYMNRKELSNDFQPYHGLPLSIPGSGPLKSVYDTNSAVDGINAFKGGGVSLTVDQDLSFAKLVSITSYRRGTGSYQFANAPVPQPYFIVESPNSPNEDYTQELQLISPKTGRFNWVVGTFYYHNSLGANPIYRFFGGPFTPAPTSASRTTTNATEITESVAPFAQASWEFLPRTTLTGGVRYTYEKRTLEDASVVSTLVNGTSLTSTIPEKRLTIRKPTFRAALDHRFSESVLGYFSFNTGIKSGGFNSVSPANPAYLPEKLTAYEVGLKTELFDRRVRLNLAGFYYNYTNLQVIQFVGVTQTVVNGPAAKLYGLDADFEAQITHGLRASGGFELEHTEFSNYPGAVFSTPKPSGGALIFAGDATGDRLPLAQKFTATAALDYHTDVSRGALDFNITTNYNGGYFFEADNFLHQKAYVMLNSSLKFKPAGTRIGITLFGKNLFNEKVITQASTQSIGYPATFGSAPRTYGIGVSFKF